MSDYRPVPDNQEMFSDFNSESPSMVCVEIVERVGDNVTGVQSSSVREEDTAKFYLRDLKELMDATTPTRTTSNASTTKDWRFELSNGKKKKNRSYARYLKTAVRCTYVPWQRRRTAGEDKRYHGQRRRRRRRRGEKEDGGFIVDAAAEEGEEEEKKKNDNDNADYIKKKCEWISFLEERNCLVLQRTKTVTTPLVRSRYPCTRTDWRKNTRRISS